MLVTALLIGVVLPFTLFVVVAKIFAQGLLRRPAATLTGREASLRGQRR